MNGKGNYPRVNFVLAGRSIGAVLGRSQGAAADWWMAAGVTPVAAYAPKGAASLAASYINLANPGTYNAAPGVAPTWDAAGGWTFNGSNQYLSTGIIPASGWTIICRFSNLADTDPIVGMYQNVLGTQYRFYLTPNHSSGNRQYANGSTDSYLRPGAAITSGIMAMAGKTAYLNGSADGTIPAGSLASALEIRIGSEHVGYANVKIQSLWIGNTTLNAAQMAAQSAAMP